MTHHRPVLLVSYLLEELKLDTLYPAFLELTLDCQDYLGFLSKVTYIFLSSDPMQASTNAVLEPVSCVIIIRNC